MDRPSAIYESEKQLKALADVLEGKEYKNTSATNGESKWLKYIAEQIEKNQIFGKKEVEKIIVPEQTLEFVGHETIESISLAQIAFMVTESDIQSFIAYMNTNPELIHDVKIDGVLYKTKLQLTGGSIILGNGHIESPDMTDTGEPFLVLINFKGASEVEPTRAMFATTLGADKHTVSISRTDIVIAKIPKEYLPDDIGGGSSVQSDWSQTDTTASDYIKNKPTITAQVQSDWNQTDTAAKDYIKNKPTITAQVQSDWNQTDTTAKDYIKNKPNISGQGEQVQADWNQTNTTAKDYIKNKPTIIGKLGTNSGEIFNNYSDNTADGSYSHAEGTKTTASGPYSHAEGWSTKATNDSCHAEGSSTEATGYCSHAEGSNTKASEQYSHAEGTYTKAMGKYSHAEGGNTVASGQWSHAEGAYTKAHGNRAHAEGWSTEADGEASHAEGFGTEAYSKNQHVEGKFNIKDAAETYAHIVGNGTSDNSRSNAHTLDWKGNAWYAGTVEGTAMIVKSSTSGSSKRFKITVDDSGAITATEITA